MMVKAVGGLALVGVSALCLSCTDTSEDDVRADAGATNAPDRPEEALDAGSGSRFTDLYRDFFGRGGAASCAGDGACHGGAEEAGALGSGGYVCADEPGCRASMTSVLVGDIPAALAAPEATRLYRVLRHRREDGTIGGSMPRRPGYVFSRASMERVRNWISNGAPKD